MNNGDFVITFEDSSNGGIGYVLFNGDGVQLGPETIANQSISGSESNPAITALRDGQFAIAWQDASGIEERLFNADGSPATNEFLVNSTTDGQESSPSLSPIGTNGVYTEWSDASGVHGQATEFYDPTTYAGAATFFWSDAAGDVATSAVNGEQILQTHVNPSAPVGWDLVGGGDFNGDGNHDMLFRNPTTGQNAIWFMYGDVVAGESLINPTTTDWSVVGTGDFNGDGYADILWHSTSGQNAIWEMNGSTQVAAALLPSVPAGWTPVGVGDFDGDGKSDILWRSTTGQNEIWDMNGSTVTSEQLTNPVSTDWTVAGIGDFNYDNHSDILWQNTSTNQVALWEMNNATVLPNNSIITTAGPGWHLTV